MGKAYGMYGGKEKYVQDFRWGNMKDRGHLEDLEIDGIIMSRWILKD